MLIAVGVRKQIRNGLLATFVWYHAGCSGLLQRSYLQFIKLQLNLQCFAMIGVIPLELCKKVR